LRRDHPGVRRAAWTCGAALLWLVSANADEATSAARVEVLALLETLNTELLSHNSATLTLEHWCDIHRLAFPPRIVAIRVPDVDKPASAQQRQELSVAGTEPVRYRRVKLLCGALVLSEADNWYVPGRLTPEMNRLLDTTDTPFGKVVQPLHFERHTLSSRVLWDAVAPIPATLLQHKAVLTLPDGTPFSEVVESYTANVLAVK
jgi:hypothetical protein